MNIELPPLTQIMLKISNFFYLYWYLVLFGLFALIFGINMMSKTDRGKIFIDGIVLKFPVISNVVKTVMTARLCRTLSTLLRSVLMLESIIITRRVLNNSMLQAKMDRC